MSSSGARNYGIVTAAYWGFTLTDGALRMLVLLHFYRLGYSPFTLAFLFLLYEAAGVLANLIGGWLAARFGITRMLSVGLATQIIGFLLLSMLSPDWAAGLSVAWVVLAQGVCGVAKDLTKTASKSAIKITAGEASGQLFKWVAWFTGSKNAMKGVGFFLGGLLLDLLGFRGALWAMAALRSQRVSSLQKIVRLTCWPLHVLSCLVPVTYGLWSGSLSFSMPRGGRLRWWAVFWPFGPSGTGWFKRLHPLS
jgi:MFS family permease